MKQPLLLSSLLSLAAVVVQADDVITPWNKLIRDGVWAKRISTSDASRIMATVHVAQYQAVNDVLQRRARAAADVATDPALKAEICAAVAGAGETVLNLITVGSQGNMYTGPIVWHDYSKDEVDKQQGLGIPVQQGRGGGAPGQQMPGAPGQQGPGAPGQQGPGAPGQQQGPGAPGQQQGLNAPGQQGPGAPGQQMPGAPGQQGPGAPGQQQGPGFVPGGRVTPGPNGYTPLFQRQVGNDPLLMEASGRAVNFATTLVNDRANDGFNATMPEFRGVAQNGKWRPTPPEYRPAEEQQWGNVRPWVLASVQPQRLAAPPALDSPTYRQSYDEIVKLGRADSSVRTGDQSQIAKFWKKSPEISWFSILDQVTANMSVVDASRAYALASVAFADSRISAMDNKYFHSGWRPISSIAAGNGVNFPADPSYMSFLTTPPTPEYPSGHGSLAGTLAEVYTGLNGGRDAFNFAVTSPDGSITRNYNSFSQAAEETSLSRLYAGDHFRHTCVTSGEMGKQVAQAVVRDFDAKYPPAARAGAAPPAAQGRRSRRGNRNNNLRA